MLQQLSAEPGRRTPFEGARLNGRGLHSFQFQLNLSLSVHRITQLNSCMCPGVDQVELKVNECKPLLNGTALVVDVSGFTALEIDANAKGRAGAALK